MSRALPRIFNAARLILVAFLIPWAAMASLYALTQTAPPVIRNDFLRETLGLRPVWHDLPTAYRNQHRLVFAGLPVAVVLAGCLLFINPAKKKTNALLTLASLVAVAIAANALDCGWLFRGEPRMVSFMTATRSIPWIVIGCAGFFIVTGIGNIISRRAKNETFDPPALR